MQWVGVVCATIWIVGATAFLTLAGILVFPFLFLALCLAKRWSTVRCTTFLVWVYGRFWLALTWPFTRFERRGLDSAQFDTPSILVLNHLSFFDSFLLGALPDFAATFALRSWPFRMPWFRPFMNLAHYVDMESLAWDEIEIRARECFADGRHLMIFPEGHRSRDGRMGRFHSGAFKLACTLGVPVIPLCIRGTDKLLPPGRFWLAPAKVSLTFLEPILPTAFSGELAHAELRRVVKERILEAYRKDE